MIAAAQKPKPAAKPVDDDQDVIRVDVNLVSVFMVVRDKQNSFVTGLTKDDFELFENGQEQKIDRLVPESNLPLTVGLLVDVSPSQANLLEDERQGATAFFQQVMKEKDLAFLLSFGPYAELAQDLTGSPRLLEKALDTLRIVGNVSQAGPLPPAVPGQSQAGTVLYDAVYLAAKDILKREVGRKTIIMITDGIDTGSKINKEQAIRASQESDIIIYGIEYFDRRAYGYGGYSFGGGDSRAMRQMATETGGRTFTVGRSMPLNRIFKEIQDEMRSQYQLAYIPTNGVRDGSFRKIEIRPKRKDLKVQSRKGYYAVAKS